MLFAFVAAGSATAQCDWTYYADSLSKIRIGAINNNKVYGSTYGYYDPSKEHIDSTGTRHIYAKRDNGSEALVHRITSTGLVYQGNSPHPYYRLCETVGAMWKFFDGADGADNMQYLGI